MKFNIGENAFCSLLVSRNNLCLGKKNIFFSNSQIIIIDLRKNLLMDCYVLLSIYCELGSMQKLFYLILTTL